MRWPVVLAAFAVPCWLAACERGASTSASSEPAPPTPTAPRDANVGLEIATPDAAVAPDAGVVSRHTVTVPADRPAENLVITYQCSVAPHPPSTWSWYARTTYDLDRASSAQVEESRDTKQDRDALRSDSPPRKPPKPTVRKLSAAKVAAIRARLEEVYAGGPYQHVYPYSGGKRCEISVAARDQPPFFHLERAREESPDAVTRLLAELHSP
jgi:hypothetical protein